MREDSLKVGKSAPEDNATELSEQALDNVAGGDTRVNSELEQFAKAPTATAAQVKLQPVSARAIVTRGVGT